MKTYSTNKHKYLKIGGVRKNEVSNPSKPLKKVVSIKSNSGCRGCSRRRRS